jgi:hypothetical protein
MDIKMKTILPQFSGSYKLDTSLVILNKSGDKSFDPAKYLAFEKAFDSYWEEIQGMHDSVSITVNTEKKECSIRNSYSTISHWSDVVQVNLVNRFGDKVSERISRGPFRIEGVSGEDCTDCSQCNAKRVSSSDSDIHQMVQQLMARVRELIQIYKPGYIPNTKEC